MAEESVRFGILGCANIANKLSRAINLAPNSTLHAISSRSLEKATAFASTNNLSPEVKLYGSYDEVLDDPSVDAVYIPLPTSLHLEWALKSVQKKKHILLEKPPALSVEELDKIIEACNANGLQLMDCTMWMHHPRTYRMKQLLGNPDLFGNLKSIHSNFAYCAGGDFLTKDIRVKPDRDALGALGDAGWYTIRAILWANDYQMPQTVTALPGHVVNEAGVILACGATFLWQDGRVATFECSFLSHMSMDIIVHGSRGCLSLRDFVVPYEENCASFLSSSNVSAYFLSSSNVKFPGNFDTGWDPRPTEHSVITELPQEALMVEEFSRLVKSIRDIGAKPDLQWSAITRKTQILVNAVNTSIKEGLISVTL
jgi:predicted dehydrogenase